MPIPSLRLRPANDAPIAPRGEYVLYWMIAARRTRASFALERAVERARELGKPLLVLEALRCDYQWASDRLHRFVLDGMRANAARFAAAGVSYYPYVERAQGEGKGLLAALASRACLVVTDDYPCFFLPAMVRAAGRQLAVRLEAVDGNGLLPIAAAEQVYQRAYDFRRFLQRTLPDHLADRPVEDPLAAAPGLPRLAALPAAVARRWPPAQPGWLAEAANLAALPIDHAVAPSPLAGGEEAARATLASFVASGLGRYAEERNHPDEPVTSGLSPYLHFGHLGAHQVLAAVEAAEGWHPGRLSDKGSGARAGWWGMSTGAEAFLDQLVTWRELGFNLTARSADYDRFESLPAWARRTLEVHAADPRTYLYDLASFEAATTHDEIWNAAQRQLVRDGLMHNYLRMLWGKMILGWSATPREALATMIELNNKYTLDGRDPNSYSGIFWCLGRYDRPWGPEREVFGTVRYMTSASTRRKLKLDGYLRRYGTGQPSLF